MALAHERPCLAGWEWDGPWRPDKELAGCDEEGWTYARDWQELQRQLDAPEGSCPVAERQVRWRRFVRPRHRVAEEKDRAERA